MTTWTSRAIVAAAASVATLGAVVASGCGVGPIAAHLEPAPNPPPVMSPVRSYLTAVDMALHDHLQVWIETDLVRRWEAGPSSFRAGVRRVAFLANRQGVAGIKIADELGYHDGMDSAGKIGQFLSASARALHQAAPHALILVDMVVPELGCLPGHQPAGSAAAACAADARARFPQLALPEIDGYLRMHAIDVLDLSTGLLPERTYTSWGATADAAQRAAWQEAARRGWPDLVRLQARKALAHPGRYTGTPAQAEAELRTFVDIPLANGAHAVDIWAWHQEYEGSMYRLLDPGLRTNALWSGLEQRRRARDVLFTNMSPHSIDFGLEKNLAMIASVFGGVLLPAGTG